MSRKERPKKKVQANKPVLKKSSSIPAKQIDLPLIENQKKKKLWGYYAGILIFAFA